MRILFYNWRDLAHPAAGGAEVWTEMVARHLVSKGHEVTLFCASVKDRLHREVVEGVTIIRRGGRLSVYREGRKFFAESGDKFDLVLDEINTRPFLTPRFVGATPVVAIAHQVAREVWFHEAHLPMAVMGRYFFEPRWLREYRDVPTLTLCPSSAASLREYGLRNVHAIIPGGDPIAPPQVEKETVPTIVFLGRLVSSKRPDHAIEALTLLQKQHPEARLWIIGDGPMHNALKRKSPPHVEFYGRLPHDERNELLARAHVLVATSVREGWGLNVSEAAEVGTPAIGYNVCGLVDSVAMSGGHVVEESPAALAEALRAFFDHELTLTPRVPTQTWQEVGDAVDDIIRRVHAAAP